MIYAYACGERSSRRIERLCTDHVAYRVVCAQDPPDPLPSASHDTAFTDMFAQVLRLCAQAGMVSVGVISIDGTKIAANAAKCQPIPGLGARSGPPHRRGRGARGGRRRCRRGRRRPPSCAAWSWAPRPRGPRRSRSHGRAHRQDARDAAADAADRERQEQYLRQVEAGLTPVGPPPAGIDKVRLYEVRIARDQQRLAELGDGGGKPITERRSDLRKSIKRWQAALAGARPSRRRGWQISGDQQRVSVTTKMSAEPSAVHRWWST